MTKKSKKMPPLAPYVHSGRGPDRKVRHSNPPDTSDRARVTPSSTNSSSQGIVPPSDTARTAIGSLSQSPGRRPKSSTDGDTPGKYTLSSTVDILPNFGLVPIDNHPTDADKNKSDELLALTGDTLSDKPFAISDAINKTVSDTEDNIDEDFADPIDLNGLPDLTDFDFVDDDRLLKEFGSIVVLEVSYSPAEVSPYILGVIKFPEDSCNVYGYYDTIDMDPDDFCLASLKKK